MTELEKIEEAANWMKQYTEDKKRLETLEKENAELEQENAELKEELTKKADTNHIIVEALAKLDEENAKAKEIIKELVSCIRRINEPDVEMKLTDVDVFLQPAEDFIKELDK